MNLEELKAWILLNRLMQTATRRFVSEGYTAQSPREILDRIRRVDLWKKRAALRQLEKEFESEREAEKCFQLGLDLIAYDHALYPESLKEIDDPPLLLYCKGRFSETDRAAVAIVGARRAGAYGVMHSRRISAELAEAGCTIISGLAQGIDQAAHEGALEVSYGRTAAVLGCGLDRIYPKVNIPLAERIGNRGFLISEYGPGTPPLAHHFPRRNRIIAGLSLGVFVAEAHQRSGSLLTAREALEQGKEIFAMPGPIDRPGSAGPHALIRAGAILADSSHIILENLAVKLSGTVSKLEPSVTEEEPVSVPEGETQAEQAMPAQESRCDDLLKCLNKRPLSFEELMMDSGREQASLSRALLELEIGQRIRKMPDGRFEISKSSF